MTGLGCRFGGPFFDSLFDEGAEAGGGEDAAGGDADRDGPCDGNGGEDASAELDEGEAHEGAASAAEAGAHAVDDEFALHFFERRQKEEGDLFRSVEEVVFRSPDKAKEERA